MSSTLGASTTRAEQSDKRRWTDADDRSETASDEVESALEAAQLASGEYGIAAAAVLPCFWIYQVVGTELLDTAGDLEKHPYGDWIGMYANPVFAEETKIVRGIVDRAAEGVLELQRQRMRDAFVQASRYEWMFWDAAWRMETWPI